MNTPIVGIDLGTTNSLAAIFRDGTPTLVPNVHGQFLTPSVVGVLENGEVVVGEAATHLQITRPERCTACFKRLMGTEEMTVLPGMRLSPAELSSLVLRALKADVEAVLGTDVTDAVITVPAYFNDNQRQATKLAGEMAGLTVRRIINEPTAAALTYGFHDSDAEKHIQVFDLGGGTFDVTIMEVFEGTLEIIATAGEGALGGEDFTDRIADTILRQRGTNIEAAELHAPLMLSRLRAECERAKRDLLTDSSASIRIPDSSGEISGAGGTIELSRDEFSEHVQDLIKRLARPIHKTLYDADLKKDDIAEIILVGGATRMPVIYDFISVHFGKEPRCQYNPDEVVALGAAIQGALINDDRAVDDLVMTDVCPFTLGIEIAKSLRTSHVEGYFLPIIHRNTTIPVSKEEIVSTLHPGQTEVIVKVYQGDARKVTGNLYLGELSVSGLPAQREQVEVCVRFTYDLNGILEVEAYVPQTGRKYKTVLTRHMKGLSPAEVEQAVTRMQMIKFYPREDEANRKLLLFAERVVGEVNPRLRHEIDAAVDLFEHAMMANDRDVFNVAKGELLATLSSLGFKYDDNDKDQETSN